MSALFGYVNKSINSLQPIITHFLHFATILHEQTTQVFESYLQFSVPQFSFGLVFLIFTISGALFSLIMNRRISLWISTSELFNQVCSKGLKSQYVCRKERFRRHQVDMKKKQVWRQNINQQWDRSHTVSCLQSNSSSCYLLLILLLQCSNYTIEYLEHAFSWFCW